MHVHIHLKTTIHLERNVEVLRRTLNKSIYEYIPNASDCITNTNRN